jgi:FkbH-like protein
MSKKRKKYWYAIEGEERSFWFRIKKFLKPKNAAFEDLRLLHNGEDYLSPTDLALTTIRPRRVLVIGSCLAEVWCKKIDCPYDYVLSNNVGQLPETPPQPGENYDLQLIQVPLRFVLPDDALWRSSFSDRAAYEKVFQDSIERLRLYLSTACYWNKKYKLLTFVANFLVPQQNLLGKLMPRYDLRNPAYFVEQLNCALGHELAAYENAYILDIESIAAALGKKYIQDDAVDLLSHGGLFGNGHYEKDRERIEPIERMTAHYEFRGDAFLLATWHWAMAMYRSVRQDDAVKLVIVDLDHTLWRGVIAEEEHIDYQTIEGWPLGFLEALAYLKKRGVILAIASKNDETLIRSLWDKIVQGRMSMDDFAIVKINWKPKTENIEEILKLVNVLPRSAVFIDDNPVERAAVKAAFPDMRVLGKYPYYLKRILLWSAETQNSIITAESSRKTEMIQSQVERENLRQQLTRADFLATLDVTIKIDEVASIKHPHFPRAFELINKSNQFNTTGRRWTKEECDACFAKGWIFYTFNVKDRFTNYGLVGCALVHENNLEQFVMSCRVIGLDVEATVLADLEKRLQKEGATEMRAQLIETSANFACRDLYEKCGFQKTGNEWVYSFPRLQRVGHG